MDSPSTQRDDFESRFFCPNKLVGRALDEADDKHIDLAEQGSLNIWRDLFVDT